MKKLLLSVLLMIVSGCSKENFMAKIHVFKAENALTKAASLKEKRAAYGDRVPLYKMACLEFKSAFDSDPSVFTINRIEEAMDACWRSGDKDNEDVFRVFEGQYAQAHPQEYEHGDAGVGMMEMG